MKFIEQLNLVCFIESNSVYCCVCPLVIFICLSLTKKRKKYKCLLTSQQTQNHMVQLSPEAHKQKLSSVKNNHDSFSM